MVAAVAAAAAVAVAAAAASTVVLLLLLLAPPVGALGWCTAAVALLCGAASTAVGPLSGAATPLTRPAGRALTAAVTATPACACTAARLGGGVYRLGLQRLTVCRHGPAISDWGCRTANRVGDGRGDGSEQADAVGDGVDAPYGVKCDMHGDCVGVEAVRVCSARGISVVRWCIFMKVPIQAPWCCESDDVG